MGVVHPGHSFGGNATAVLTVAWVECFVAMLVLIARYYTQVLGLGRLGWDILWVSIATVLALVAQIFLTLSTTYGIANHIDAIRKEDAATGGEFEWIFNILTIFSSIFGKFAIVALLLRIQGPTHRYQRMFLLCIVGSAFAINSIQTVLIFSQCQPIQGLWDHSIEADCHLLKPFLYTGTFQGSYSAFTDFVLAIYPIYFFWNLQMTWKMKLGLISLFLGGTVAGIAAAIKTSKIVTLGSQEDETFVISGLIYWTTAEMWLIIIMGSIPPLRPLLTKVFRKVDSTIHNTRSRNYSTGYSKSREGSSKASQTLQSIELGKLRQPFGRSATDRKLGSEVEGDSYAILDRSAADARSSEDDPMTIKVTTNVTINHEQNVERSSSRADNDLERGVPFEYPAHYFTRPNYKV
ncbi:MAG: hypothetical protein M1820_002700 [Bogoriella megaspora]|nr:MAG: hypothetical protein M1820_002700 [Bogoriella megaspora]